MSHSRIFMASLKQDDLSLADIDWTRCPVEDGYVNYTPQEFLKYLDKQVNIDAIVMLRDGRWMVHMDMYGYDWWNIVSVPAKPQ